MGCFPLRGLDRNAWLAGDEDDLMAVKARTARDPFSKWFMSTVVPTYHRIIGERLKVPAPKPSFCNGWGCRGVRCQTRDYVGWEREHKWGYLDQKLKPGPSTIRGQLSPI